MASSIVSRPFPAHNFNYVVKQQDYIRPIVVRNVSLLATNTGIVTASSRPALVVVPENDKSSSVTQTSPASEASCSISSSSWDIHNDSSTNESSSLLREDRFDRQASQHVQSLFANLESNLFDDDTGSDGLLQNECEEWRSTFPHLRVVGSMLVATADDPGFQMYDSPNIPSPANNAQSDVSPRPQTSQTTLQKLIVTGHQLDFWRPATFITDSLHDMAPSSTGSVEEVIASEGQQEEILAIDDSPRLKRRRKALSSLRHRQRSSRIPLSPQSCWRSTICGGVFDELWSQIISDMRPLISKYSRHFIHDGKSPQFVTASHNILAAYPLSPPATSSSSMKFPSADKTAAKPSGSQLRGLLTVCSKTLLERDKQFDAVPVQRLRRSSTMHHPMLTSSVQPSVSPQSMVGSGLAVDSRSVAFSSPRPFERQGSARRPVTRGRHTNTVPIDQQSLQPAGAAVEEQLTDLTVVRGHRLSVTAIDRQPALSALPPLTLETSKSSSPTAAKSVQRISLARAASAVTGRSTRLNNRDKTSAVPGSRPNTMQISSRTDGPVSRRSSTAFSMHSHQPLGATGSPATTDIGGHRLSRSSFPGKRSDPWNTMRPEIHRIQLQRYNTISGYS